MTPERSSLLTTAPTPGLSCKTRPTSAIFRRSSRSRSSVAADGRRRADPPHQCKSLPASFPRRLRINSACLLTRISISLSSTKFFPMNSTVPRGDGKGRVFLTFDTTPNYTDTFPSPPRRPSGNTAPSTVWAMRRWASGAIQWKSRSAGRNRPDQPIWALRQTPRP